MATQRYSVTPHPIATLLTWVQSGEIAIPEIQRPFVWKATQVRNLLDSLYRGFPVGYLIAWRNPTVRLKDGSPSAGKRILIDGQQRVTALMASLLGREVVTKNYRRRRIRIAFHPQKNRFEVANPAIRKDRAWIADIAEVFAPDAKLLKITHKYAEKNPGTDVDEVFSSIEALRQVVNNHVGVIELAEDLDVETVAEIFIRVNSEGTRLNQADFAMSKISVNEEHGGSDLRKAIDYFSHLAVAPEDYRSIHEGDVNFAKTEYFTKLSWLKSENDDIYDPSYADMLRVAFTTEFKRGRLEDLVALLSGRNFETKQFEEAVVEDTFERLGASVLQFMNETHFKRFVMIVRSAGFVRTKMIRSQNVLSFAYILYLTLRKEDMPNATIEGLVRRWLVLSILTGRYSGSPESAMDLDIRQIHTQGAEAYLDAQIAADLSDAFWTAALPQAMDTPVASSPYFRVFQAAQVKMGDHGFLSRDITARELVEVKSDVHHVFPKALLKKHGLTRSRYNQIANYVVAQSEINIAIASKAPEKYFAELEAQVNGGPMRYGGIDTKAALDKNLRQNCIPAGMADRSVEVYDTFLTERRHLMATKIRTYFESL